MGIGNQGLHNPQSDAALESSPGYGDFHDTRALSTQQITTLASWADSGAPEGSPHTTPALPSFPAPGKWTIGTPDLELKPEALIILPRRVKMSIATTYCHTMSRKEQYIRGIEFKAGNRAIVHHIILFLDLSGNRRVGQSRS